MISAQSKTAQAVLDLFCDLTKADWLRRAEKVILRHDWNFGVERAYINTFAALYEAVRYDEEKDGLLQEFAHRLGKTSSILNGRDIGLFFYNNDFRPLHSVDTALKEKYALLTNPVKLIFFEDNEENTYAITRICPVAPARVFRVPEPSVLLKNLQGARVFCEDGHQLVISPTDERWREEVVIKGFQVYHTCGAVIPRVTVI
ncbi:hypothetical protein [Thermococcus sp. MAR1]|uniref:hypothetical protein n=1 Tax=Thermococcus sp. MAR1 TaxID=1638263 RepID=UPI00143B08E4|nr:hypothetical protein [Thermococcus sp. MAR1]NJE09336.1 hypothetical protein [Thermococcus sp. MAR1]